MKSYMRTPLLAAVTLISLALPSTLLAQRWQWTQLGRGPDHDQASRVIADSIGNSYVLGRYAGTIAFGNTLLSGIGLWDLFVAKFNPAGTLQWAAPITSGGTDLPGDIAVDRKGNIYVSGTYAGQGIINGVVVQSVGASDVFVAKIDPFGVVQWARSAGGPSADFGSGIGLDESGERVYIAGSFSGTASFSGDNVTSRGGQDIFVAQYSTDQGGIQWARGGGGLKDDAAYGLGVDKFGSAFVAGTFIDSALFLSNSVATVGSDSGATFVVKYDFAGIPRFAVSAGAFHRRNGPLAVAVDIEGNTFLAGSFTDTARIGTSTLVSRGGYDAFLVRYNPFGGFRWALQFGDTLNDFAFGAGVDVAGNAYFTGALANVGSITPDTANIERMFVARVSANGALVWVDTSDGGRVERGLDVAVDRLGNHYVGGSFSDTLLLDNQQLIATGGLSDLFVGRLGPDATVTTTRLADTIACAGSVLHVNYTVGGSFFSDNTFVVELSDSIGSFARPIAIGSRATAGAGLIVATIPDTMPSGTGYRIRVSGRSPIAIGSDNGSDFDIEAKPKPIIARDRNDTICRGEVVTLDAGEGYTSYRWSTGALSRTISVTEAGQYSVTVTTPNDCAGTSQPVRIVVSEIPAKPVILHVDNTLRVAAAFRHQWYRNGDSIPGATRERITPILPGSYTVTSYSEAGCNATSDPFLFTTTSVREEFSQSGIIIERVDTYSFEVNSSLGCDVEVELVDMTGRAMIHRSSGTTLRIDLAQLPVGSYMMRVKGCGVSEITRKVVR